MVTVNEGKHHILDPVNGVTDYTKNHEIILGAHFNGGYLDELK